MGDAQSVQRERDKDAEAEEQSGEVDDAPAQHNTEEKPLRISEINGKADITITAEVNGTFEEEITAVDILSPDVSGRAKQIKDEETPLENVDINEKKSPNEADADEEEPLEIIEMDAKQNDIHDSFQRFFSNISLKLSVKRGSVGNDQIETDVSDETNKNDSNRTEHIMETAKEAECDNVEQNIDPNTQGTCDNDSTTCPTLTDVTSEDIPENAQEKKAETKEEAESDNVDTATSSPVADDEMVQKDVMCEDLNSAPTSSPETEEVVSPVKRFFTTGIFSGLRKKKKSIEDDSVERELVEMDKGTAKTKDKSEDTQHDNEVSPLDIEADTVKTENKEKDPIEENLCAASAPMMDEGESTTTNSATVTTNEPENKGSQDIVQDSPLKWLLSGSSFRKASKKQRGRKSSHEKLSDSGEHSDQLKTPAKPSETLKEESPAQFSAETAGEEDGAWASFKKLLTPKKHMKRSSLTNEETQITGALGETKPSEVEQISNNGTEEGKKRKDSSVSWEAVLCGSGKKSRSRKTSDSEEETPQTEDVNKKETLESSNEVGEITAISPKPAGSPSEGDGLSTWKSFRKLVTPKKKAKDDEESKDNIQSDSEVTQEEPSFSIKKFLPGRKKKTAETQDNVSSDEADKEVASGDEDSETPAVVPLSEFDICETEVHIETQADVESHVPQEADFEPEQELLDQVAKPVVPSDSLQTETKQIQAEDDLKNEPSTAPASNEEPEDLTELFSKHHPLSDIPEEGMFTETIATPGSIAEEAVRDDTIMEDLIEITSEAITAPEHIDETEMISAVSQLSQSSNTSGNITPVPVEYDTKQTEALLQQVVETISVSPKSEPVCSEEINEAVSVETLPEVESIVADKGCPVGTGKDEKKPLDIDSQEPQSAAIIAEDSKDGAAEQDNQTSTQKEEQNLPHITDQVEFENEDQHQVEVETLQPVKELQAEQDATSGSEEGSDQLFQKEVLSDECTSEETITAEPKEETVALTEYKVDAKTEKPQEDAPQPDHSKEPEELDDVQMATINLEVDSVQLLEKDVILEGSPEETFTDKTKEALEFLTHCTDAENEDMMQTDGFQVEYFEEKLLEAVQTTTLDSKEDISWLLEKEVKLHYTDITAEETVMDKPEEETMALTEFDVKAEMENQIQAGDAQMECAEEQKEETQPLSEYNVQEGTENRLQTDAPQTAQVGKPFDFEDSGHLLPKEAISEDIPIEETVTDKLTEKNEPLTEYNVAAETDHKLQKDAAQTEHTKDPAVLEAVQTAQTILEENTSQLLEKELTLEDLKAQETVTDKPKEETQNVTEYDVKEGTENRLQTDAAQTEQVTEAVQAATLDLDDNSGQLLSKEVISDDIAAGEKEATPPLTEYDIKAKTENKFQRDAAQTLHTKDPAVLEAVQTAQSNLEENTSQLLEKELNLGDIQAQETVTDKPKEEKQPLSEYNVQEGTENRLQTDAPQTAQVGKPFDFEDSGHLLPKEVISEDIPIEETVTGKLKEKNEPLTEYNVAAETDHKLQKDAAQTEHTKDPAVLEAVQTDALVIKEGNLQTSNESDILQAIPATENFSEVGFKPDNKDQKIDAPNTDHDQAAEVVGGVSVQSLQKEALSEKTLETEAVTYEAKEEPEPLIEASEFVAAIESEHVQDHEVVEDPSSNLEDGSVQSHDKEVIPEEIPRAETVTHELTQATEGDIEPEQLAEHVTGHIQESNVNDPETETVTEEEPSMAARAVSQTVEEVSAKVLKVNEEQKTEFTPQNAQISQEDPIPEVVDELQTVTAVHVSSADEASCVQVREKPVFSEATPPALLENATFKHERMYAQNLSAVQSNVEEEERGIIPGFAAQYATVAQVITCHLKDFVASIPDPLIETKSNSYEPLIECVASQLDFKETTETATPLVKNDVTMTEGDTSVVLMNVPLVEFKDNHQIQVQVVNVDIKSAGKTVDKVLEVGITETKEVIDVCHRSVKEVDKLSAKSEIEETLIHEENRVIIQESVLVKLEQEAIKQTDDVTEMGKTAEMELSELEEQKFEDSTVGERPEGVSAVPSKQVLKDDSFNNDKENSEDPKTKVEQSKVDVTTEEVKVYSDLKKMNEETHKTQMSQSQLVMPNVEVVVPQNTGIISSMSNVESPSSLSLEFKLNIQFGQAKEPASPPPTTDRTEPVKETDVAEVGIEAVASEKEPNKKQKTTELVDVAVQGTKMTEPEPANIDQTERSVVTGQPQLLDVGIQTIETADSVKEVDKLSAKLEIEETLIHEENRAIIQDSTQHVAPESVLVKSEPEVKKQTDTVAEMSKTETELSEEEEQKVEEAAVGERPDGGSEEPEKEPEKKLKTLIDAVRGTEMTETEPADIDLKERPVFTSQPQLLDVGMQTVKTVEPAVQLKPTERGAAHVQLKETREKIMKKEKRQVFLGRPEQETKVEEPVKNTEEEVDQDVWMDAEEDVDYPEETEMSLHETEEPTEHQHKSTQGEMSAAEPDFETAPTSTVEEDGNQQTLQQIKTFETEIEAEAFAVALEHSEAATANTAIMEWD